MIKVRLATIIPKDSVGEGINDSQIATIITDDGEHRGYVKQIPNNEIAI